MESRNHVRWPFFEEAENISRFVFDSNCKMNKAMVLSSIFAVYSIFI